MNKKLSLATIAAVLALVSVSSMALMAEDSDAAYTVTFHPNGGEYTYNGGPGSYYAPVVDSSVYIPSSEFTLGGGTHRYARPGYSFLGWSENSTANAADHSPGTVRTFPGNVTLYAVWRAIDYDVTFVLGGGAQVVVQIPYGSVFDTSELNLDNMPGYRMTGWSTAPLTGTDANGAYLLPAGASTFPRKVSLHEPGGITLYPIYSKAYDISNGQQVTVTNGSGYYYFTGTSASGGIEINGGTPKVVIENLNMDFSETASSRRSPFALNNSNADLILVGNNSLKGYDNWRHASNRSVGYAGLNVPAGSTLNISYDSSGTLTAEGGKAISRTYRYSGSGIGANGYGDCGTINIYGGTVHARAGDVIGTTGGVGPGIGGLNNGAVNISGGTVYAYAGNVSGSYQTLTHRPAIYPLPNITGGEVHYSDGSIYNGETTVPVRFQLSPSNYYIGDANYITIDGHGMFLNNIEIRSNTTVIQVPGSWISTGSQVQVTTGIGNYYSGTAAFIPNGSYYRVSLTWDNSIPRADVKVHVNEASVPEGHGEFGSVSPYQNFTVASSTDITYAFDLSIDAGYEFTGMRKKASGVWGSFTDYSVQDNGGGSLRVSVLLTVGTGVNGGTNDISFQISKKQYEISVTNSLASSPSWSPSQAKIVSSGSIAWDAGYTSGIETVSYGDSRTFTINTGNSPNPYYVFLARVNGAHVGVTDIGGGSYTVTISSISSDMALDVVFGSTVKVTLDQTSVRVHDSTARIALVDPSGNPVAVTWLPDASDPASAYAFVPYGSDVRFRITYGSTILNTSKVLVNGTEIPTVPSNVYALYGLTVDTTVSAELDHVIWDVTFNAFGGSTETVEVVDKVNIRLPMLAEFQSLNLSAKPGYGLAGWEFDSGTYAPGTQISVEEDMTFTAVWSETPIEYAITYNLGGGTAANPSTYTVGSPAITLANPTRPGYTFAGWTGTDLPSPAMTATIPSGSVGDRSYSATWTGPNSVVVTLYDGSVQVDTKTYTYGGTYSGLAIYGNKPGYTFGGWALNENGSNKVFGDTQITNPDDHNLYIVWIPSSTYIVNLANQYSESGTVSAPSGCVPGDSFTVTIAVNQGWFADRIKFGADEYDLNGALTYTYTPSSDITVTVIFSPILYTVTVHEGPSGSLRSWQYDVTSPTQYLVPPASVPGYSFMGWTGTGINGTETEYVTIPKGSTGDMTFEEVWLQDSFPIHYGLNGGINNAGNPDRYFPGTSVTLLPPTKSGHLFAGWYESPDFSGSPVTGIPADATGNKSFYALFHKVVQTPAGASGLVYNGSEQTGVASNSGYSLSGTHKATDAGSYTATATLKPGHVWSDGSTGPKTVSWSIAPKSIAVVWGGTTFTYDGSPHAPTAGAETGIAGETAVLAISGQQTDAGSHIATASLSSVTGGKTSNYVLTNATTSYSIDKATLTATYPGETITYGQSPALTVTVTGFVGGESAATAAGYSAPTVTNANTDVGTYSLTPAGGSADNYQFAYVAGSLVIQNATQTVTADGYTGTYDGSPHTITVTQTGGTVTYGTSPGVYDQTSAPAYTGAGSYTVYFKVTKANHEDYTGSAAVTIEKRSVIVKADDKSKIFGEEDPELTAIVTGTVGSDQVVYTLARAPGEGVGAYTITPSGDADQGNYAVTYETGALTIAIAQVPVPDAATLTYNGSPQTGVPAGTGYTLSGQVSGTDAGSYEATASLQTGYVWSDGTTDPKTVLWSIAPRATAFAVDSIGDQVYAGSPITPEPVVKDGDKLLVEGIDYAVSYSANTDTGTVTVTIAGIGNYAGSSGTAMFTISKAPLVVEAESKSVIFNAEAPAYTFVYVGLLGADDGSSVTVGTLASDYSKGSPAGTYAIVASGFSAANYDISYIDGTLTVTYAVHIIPYDLGSVRIVDGDTGRRIFPGDEVHDGQVLIVVPSGSISGSYVITDGDGRKVGQGGEYIVDGPVHGPFRIAAAVDPSSSGIEQSRVISINLQLILSLLVLLYAAYRLRDRF